MWVFFIYYQSIDSLFLWGQRISADPIRISSMPSILLTEASKVCNLGGFCGVYGERTITAYNYLA